MVFQGESSEVKEKEETVMKGYDTIAEVYQALRHNFDNTMELGEIVSRLSKNANVLDIGCGAGIPITKFLVESGYDVTGVDISESMLKLARKNVPKAQFTRQEMTRLGFKNNSFDGLTAAYSIIHVPRERHPSLFQGFHRALKPNGIMLINVGSDAWEGSDQYYGVEMFWSHYEPDNSLEMIRDAGFEVLFGRHVVTGRETHYWILAKNIKPEK